MRVWIGMVMVAVLLAGCSSYEVTQTGRRFTDQAVSTTAITKAVEGMTIPEKLVGKSVFVELVTPGSPDENYLKRCVELRLQREGVKVAAAADGADYALVLMAEMSGTDTGRSSIQVPVPFAGEQMILYAHVEETGYTRLRPYLYSLADPLQIEELGLAVGKSRFKRMKIAIFDVTRTDIYDSEKRGGWLKREKGR